MECDLNVVYLITYNAKRIKYKRCKQKYILTPGRI